jgi:hypothetical protein
VIAQIAIPRIAPTNISRLNLGHTGSTDFEMFESLELLVLGIHGKLCLWKALQAASRLYSRLREYNFAELIGRAEQQYNKWRANVSTIGTNDLLIVSAVSPALHC